MAKAKYIVPGWRYVARLRGRLAVVRVLSWEFAYKPGTSKQVPRYECRDEKTGKVVYLYTSRPFLERAKPLSAEVDKQCTRLSRSA